MIAVSKKNFSQYKVVETADPLRASGGDVGGGSETLVICSIKEQSEHCNTMTTKGQTDNMSKQKN